MPSLKVRNIGSLQAMDSIKDVWLAFQNLKNGPSVFQSWIWNRLWCECVLATLKRINLNVQVVEDETGRILSILPFFDALQAKPFFYLTQFLGHRLCFHNDILLAEPDTHDLASAVVDVVLSYLGNRTIFHLRHLSENSLFTKQLAIRGLAEYQCDRLQVTYNANNSDHLTLLSRNRRYRIKKNEKKLKSIGEISYQFCNKRSFTCAFDKLIELHRLRFESMQRSSLLEGDNLAFLRKAFEILSFNDQAEIIQLRLNESIIAAILLCYDRESVFVVNAGFDPAYSLYQPMWQLILKSINHSLYDQSFKIFDFGPGYELYKYSFAPMIGSNYFSCFGGKNIYTSSLSYVYRKIFKYRLPSSKDFKKLKQSE